MSENIREWSFRSIRVERINYGPKKGQYEVSVKYGNDAGENFEIRIPKEQADKILEIIADQVVVSASQMALNVSHNIKRALGDWKTEHVPYLKPLNDTNTNYKVGEE